MSDTFNRASVLQIAFEELERARFKKTANEEIAIRISSREDDAYGLIVDEVSSTLIYLGEGLYGALTSEPKWRIKKIDTTTGVVIKAASEDFNQIWDDRAGLTYV